MLDLEAEYNNRARVPEHPQHIARWARDAAEYRVAMGDLAVLDVAYGDTPRERADIFIPPSGQADSVALFIHGGYWQALAKGSFSHMAKGPNGHGVTVIVAGYTLCPDTTIGGILEEMKRCVAMVVKRFGKPVIVYGHSAGGHLAAALMASDWSALRAEIGFDPVPAALPISGLFELWPLIPTSINEKLKLDDEAARALSPILWPAPRAKRMVAVVGGAESAEFRRQNQAIVDVWAAGGVSALGVEVPGADHFTVIGPLADPTSDLTRGLVALTR